MAGIDDAYLELLVDLRLLFLLQELPWQHLLFVRLGLTLIRRELIRPLF